MRYTVLSVVYMYDYVVNYMIRNKFSICFIYFQGGNDHEIFMDERTIGHSVKNPSETRKLLEELVNNGSFSQQ